MLKLAFRNIFRNRLRTALTLAAITTGVVAIIISGGFVEDVFVQLRESTIRSRIGHVQVFRYGYNEYGGREPSRYMITQPAPVADAIGHIPHVRTVMARLNFSGLINNGRANLSIVGEGIEPDKEAQLGTGMAIIAGRALSGNDTFGAVIGEGVATAMHLRPGSQITLMVNTLEGALNTLECEVVGVFRTFSKEYDDRAIRISLVSAQELLFTQSVHNMVVLLDDTRTTDTVTQALKTQLESLGHEIKSWDELADFYQKTEALYRRQLGALQFIVLVMLVLSVTSTINMVVHERTGEFGTLLALGLRQRQIFKLVMIENTLLGLIGSMFGVLLGTALAGAISNIGIAMPPPPGSNIGYTATIQLAPWILGTAATIGILAAIMAALLPARRASRLVIVNALRQNI
ncbi:ABC transporter permease [Nitrosovibrio sp. Nv17]|jgi:putative ABC transport system permease protein|uniref:ABC transporter permease n=1 Tax=Nitrosovibrio sp. Nv17 TaxID=1855339 RepID=UPI00090864B0|nr:ABC transporter permease [Nitrosovibrio sp. Nv17]SFW11306.1 putative ABC transport system permease protein [Nitrosovibrio sp. Nv17]